MKSIRTKTTLLTVCAIVATLLVTTILGIVAIRNIGFNNSEQLLLSLCETGEKNLNSYFDSVEKSVKMVSAYIEADLAERDESELPAHLSHAREMFQTMAQSTPGVLTYYYRIDPAFSDTEPGFWFVNLDGRAFVEHVPTDISLYDTNDTSQLVWFTVPKVEGKPVWLPPYITENLDKRVISYNEPIYWNGQFIGVAGIEIDYSTMAEQVDNIKLYDHGYAFINDKEGTIIYHPYMDVTTMEEQPKVPEGLLSRDKFITYTFEGEEKQAVWLPLHNGMRLNVTVPVSEINAGWHKWVNQIIVISVVLLAVFILITLRFTSHITKPLRDLTEVAEQVNNGNFDCEPDYEGDDEVGVLTKAFRKLIRHLKTYIGDLNDLAYADALTSVHNKGAFDKYIQSLQAEADASDTVLEFAVGFFDCNGLKNINDEYGHAKGDAYLKNTCNVICEVFSHSPVFRIGGDEFAVVLRNNDYENRDTLFQMFDEICAIRRFEMEDKWKQLDVARGVAVYDPETDESVNDVVMHADKNMYENKWRRKMASE